MKIRFVSIGVALLVTLGFGANAYAQDEPPPNSGFAWRCVPTGRNSVQCQFKNTGRVPASMCVEVVKVCKRGDHSAYVCTDHMNPGDMESRVVDNFDPKVKFFESCAGIEYRNKKVEE